MTSKERNESTKARRMKHGIMKRGESWSFVVETPRDPVTNKRRQKWYSGYKTRAEAERARTKVLHELNTGRFVEESKLTMREFMNEWLEAIRGTVRESTWQTYKVQVLVHIIPNLGSIRVQRLTAANLDGFYRKLQTEGKKSQRSVQKSAHAKVPTAKPEQADEKKGLSVKTVRNIHIVIHKALDYAVDHNLVRRNVASSANVPKPACFGEHEMKTWDAAQLKRFLDFTESNRYHSLFVLAATTGMRRGELLGLRWCDVDLERRELSIRQTLTSQSYKVTSGPPKTNRSTRCITLDPRTIVVLQTHKAKQAAERLAKGPEYIETGLVFTKEEGGWVHPDRLSHLFGSLVKKSGLPKIRFHDIRHTYATLALQQEVNVKVVSERLGHSSVAFTMDVYQHVLPTMQKDAAETVAAAIFGV